MKTICTYDDWSVFEREGRYYVTDEEGEREVTLIRSLAPEEYEDVDIFDILDMCDDYDYSGELDDCSAYCFWEVVSNE